MNDVNYIYISSDNPIRVIFNGTNEVITEHLSFINTKQTFDINIQNDDDTLLENNIQILWGRVEESLT
jgi:hypothetical protein